MKQLLFLFTFLFNVKAYSQTPITDDNFHSAINTCLSVSPVKGLCPNTKYGSMPDWDVSNVTDMSGAFQTKRFFNADISNWDVSNVTNMQAMFTGAHTFDRDLSDWDVAKVTDMRSMFNGAAFFNSDLSNWDVSKVNNMSFMFYAASSFSSDISGWDVSNVTDMGAMFYAASAFNSDLSTWDVSNVSKIGSMFALAFSFNSDLNSWDVSNVSVMQTTFLNAVSFDHDLSNWDVSNVTNMTRMFSFSGLSTATYDSILIGWSQQNLKSDVYFGASEVNYCNGDDARQSLIDNYGWKILDGGYDNCTTVSVIDEDKLMLSIYPNPTTGHLNIEGNANQLSAVVFDMLGKEILTQSLSDSIDLSQLENGIYILTLSDNQKVYSQKIIKI